MKRRLFSVAFFMMLMVASPVHGQTPETTDAENRKILEIIKLLQAQQLQIADNQAKLDAGIDALSEAIRVARIEASRVGQPPPPPKKK